MTTRVQALTKVVVDSLHKAVEAVEALTHHSHSNRWAFLLKMDSLEIRKTKAVVVCLRLSRGKAARCHHFQTRRIKLLAVPP
jgi:hypothetical protein